MGENGWYTCMLLSSSKLAQVCIVVDQMCTLLLESVLLSNEILYAIAHTLQLHT